MVLMVYVGAQLLAAGDRSGLIYLAASPLLGTVVFALRRRFGRQPVPLAAIEGNSLSLAEAGPTSEVVNHARRMKFRLLAAPLLSTAVYPVIDLTLLETDANVDEL